MRACVCVRARVCVSQREGLEREGICDRQTMRERERKQKLYFTRIVV